MLSVSKGNVIIVHLLCTAIAKLRCRSEAVLTGSPRYCVLAEDYELVRRLLQALPVAAEDGSLKAVEQEAAEVLYQAFVEAHEERTWIGDDTVVGESFSITDASKTIACAMGTSKRRIESLVKNGVLRQVYKNKKSRPNYDKRYRFLSSAIPPFGQLNPFRNLPTLDESKNET